MTNSDQTLPSDGYTIGVEEEYQLVDPRTGELRSHGGAVLRADRTGELVAEVQQTMLEIGTPICTSAAMIRERLRERRFQAASAAASEDLEILSASTHPFSSWEGQVLSDGERPRMLARLFRQLLRQQSIWGMHVHVAVPEEVDRAVLMNTVRTYGSHLLALSCSSPYHLGADSGFASFRTVTWRGFPFVGVPPSFESWDAYRAYVDLLVNAGTIPDERALYWSVRPSPRYPTIELRMCDASPRLVDAVALAALARAIVVGAVEGVLPALGDSLGDSMQQELLRENEWMVARDGLEATLALPEAAEGRMRARDAVAHLLDTVAPIARRLGDEEELAHLQTILAEGNAADRMRRYVGRGHDLASLVDHLVEETRAGTGIDRRVHSRETGRVGSAAPSAP